MERKIIAVNHDEWQMPECVCELSFHIYTYDVLDLMAPKHQHICTYDAEHLGIYTDWFILFDEAMMVMRKQTI